MPTGTALGTQSGGATYAAEQLLKTDFLPVLRDQFPEDIVLLKLLRRSSDNVETGGDSAKWALRFGRNSSVGFLPPGGQMPTPGYQTSVKASTILKTAYGRLRIEDKLVKMARKDKWAFRNKLVDEMERLILDLKHEVNRTLHMDGTGNLGVIASAAGPTNNIYPLTMSTTTLMSNLNPYGASYDIYSTAGSLKISNALSTSISGNVLSLNCGGAYTWAAGDFIVRTTAYNNEANGLSNIVNTSTSLFSVNPSTYPRWNATVASATACVDPNDANLEPLRMNVIQNGGEIDFWLTSFNAQARFGTLQTPLKRFNNTLELPGGFDQEAVEFDGRPVFGDNCVQYGAGTVGSGLTGPWRWYGIDADALAIAQTGDISWMDEDGNILVKVPDFLAYDGMLVYYFDLICKQRNALSVHTGIQGF